MHVPSRFLVLVLAGCAAAAGCGDDGDDDIARDPTPPAPVARPAGGGSSNGSSAGAATVGTSASCIKPSGRWLLTFQRQASSSKVCDPQFADGYLKRPVDREYNLDTNVTRGCDGSSRQLGDGTSCVYKNYYRCIKFDGSRLYQELDGRIVAPGRFEGTLTIDYIGDGSCLETYDVRGTPL